MRLRTRPNKALEPTGFCISVCSLDFSVLMASLPVAQSFGGVRHIGAFSVLSVSPWLFSPQRHRGHRESFLGRFQRGADFFSCISGGSRLTSQRSDIAGRRCAYGDLGRRRFKAMRITPPNQTLQRRQRLGVVPWSLWYSWVRCRRSRSFGVRPQRMMDVRLVCRIDQKGH